MKTRMLLAYLFLQSILVCSANVTDSSNDVTAIIPVPQFVEMQSGTFSLSPKSVIHASDELKELAVTLTSQLKIAAKVTLKTAKDAEKNAISLKIDKALLNKYGKEAYTLNITLGKIDIAGASPAGVYYGIQTLRQLLPPATFAKDYKPKENTTYNIPCLKIIDYPRFQWRSLMIDSCRHFFPVAQIKKMIDTMSLMKMNKMHWHLTEDQGWRIEINKYPKLTKIGSIRSESPMKGNRKKKDGKQYGPFFYTQEQIKDVVKYAQERFITIVPEIEMPGHSIAALTAYPELGCTGGPYKVRTSWGVEPDIYCAGNEKSFEFLQDVLMEVMALFPSKFIHIGGDEAPKKKWEKCPKCQTRIKKEGLKNEYELQSYFIKRMERFLASHGRRLVGWDEILEGGLAPGATVMSWRGEKGGIKAAKMGHDAIMTPTSHCYLDHYESKQKGEPESICGHTTLAKSYSYNPIPKSLSKKQAKHILGVQGNLWAEFIWTPEDQEYKAFPRGCALAEVGWTNYDKKDYTDFIQRLKIHLKRFDAMGVNYRKLDKLQPKE